MEACPMIHYHTYSLVRILYLESFVARYYIAATLTATTLPVTS